MLGAAWPASSMNGRPSDSRPSPANIEGSDANVVDTTGTTRKNVCHRARVAELSGRPLPLSTSMRARRLFLIVTDSAMMKALWRASAARNNSVRAAANASSAQGEVRSRRSSSPASPDASCDAAENSGPAGTRSPQSFTASATRSSCLASSAVSEPRRFAALLRSASAAATAAPAADARRWAALTSPAA